MIQDEVALIKGLITQREYLEMAGNGYKTYCNALVYAQLNRDASIDRAVQCLTEGPALTQTVDRIWTSYYIAAEAALKKYKEEKNNDTG